MIEDVTNIDGPNAAAETSGQTAEPVAAPKRSRKVKAKEKAVAIEQRIGHSFADPALLTTALTHVSALKSGGNRADSYQRLEFLGAPKLSLTFKSDKPQALVCARLNDVAPDGRSTRVNPLAAIMRLSTASICSAMCRGRNS